MVFNRSFVYLNFFTVLFDTWYHVNGFSEYMVTYVAYIIAKYF